MGANSVSATAAGVALTLATEVTVVSVSPQGSNQVNAGITVLITATAVVKGAASATTCGLTLRRGIGTGGAIVTGPESFSVDAAATARTCIIAVTETAANFNAANGQYTLTATAAGAAQTADLAVIQVEPQQGGV